MNKQLLSAAILLCAALPATAQTVEQQVAQIRQQSTSTTRQIEQGLQDKTSGLHHAMWTIGGERDGQQWAAVGTMKTSVEFYFDGEADANEEPADARRVVRQINSSYSSSSRLRSFSRYLFDANSGALIFAQTAQYEDSGTIKRRFYFAKNKLIRVVRGDQNLDRNIPGQELQLAAEAAQDAKRLQRIFSLMFSA